MHSCITGIEYHLPSRTLTTDCLSARFPEWDVPKIENKTGIRTRHVAALNECASDLGYAAAERIFQTDISARREIDFLLFCTQSPDYAVPTTACLLQRRLGLSENCGALDFNLGCSGFVYGLGLAEGLIASGQAHSVLLITAETYSKYIDGNDKSTLAIFGDGAAATLLSARKAVVPYLGPFVYGTDGQGCYDFFVPGSGARSYVAHPESRRELLPSTVAAPGRLFMDGARIFEFALQRVPTLVRKLLKAANLLRKDIDLFVFHQANAYMLEELRRILRIPRDKFQVTLKDCANTAASTIPIALKTAHNEGRLRGGAMIMLVSFGVGYSLGATILRWDGLR